MKKRKAATDPPPPPPFSQEEVIAAALAGDVEQLRAYMDAPSARRSKRGRWLDAAHSGGCCGLRPLDAAVLSNSPAAIKLLAEHVDVSTPKASGLKQAELRLTFQNVPTAQGHTVRARLLPAALLRCI